LFTIEAAGGKGVGRALIKEVYRRAKQAGSAEVYWQTQETNATAMKLYDKVARKSGFLIYQKLCDFETLPRFSFVKLQEVTRDRREERADKKCPHWLHSVRICRKQGSVEPLHFRTE
jgi:ribosomal protein S18 acetylase RimI-like enzyme